MLMMDQHEGKGHLWAVKTTEPGLLAKSIRLPTSLMWEVLQSKTMIAKKLSGENIAIKKRTIIETD